MTECSQRWSKEPPTEPGWYWWRDCYGTLTAHPVKVSRSIVYLAEGTGSEWLAFGIYEGSKTVEEYVGVWWPEKINVPA